MTQEKPDPFEKAKKIRKGELDSEMPTYDELTQWLIRCPKTWTGGLLRQVVSNAVHAPFFKTDEALLAFVQRVIDDCRNPTWMLRDGEQKQ